jgi:predicted nuclease with TOPRIM domain
VDAEQATIPQSVGVVTYRQLLDRIQRLEQAIVVADITNQAIVQAAQQRTSLAKSELQAMQDHFLREKEQGDTELAARQDAQETKLSETKEAILALRSENDKLRASLSSLRAKVNDANQVNETLYQQGLALGRQVDLIGNKQVPTMERANQKLERQILAVKADNKLLTKQVMIHQDTYMDQARGRLKYQETMAAVLTAMHKAAAATNAITAKKRSSALNRNVQEHVVVLALGAESNAKAVMVRCCGTGGADANVHKTLAH